VHHVRRDEAHVTADVDTAALDAVLALLPRFGVRSLVAHPPTLEDLFLREYSDELATLGVPEEPQDDAPARRGDAR
jgi:ABC-2 type transport system ATP-binding protein